MLLQFFEKYGEGNVSRRRCHIQAFEKLASVSSLWGGAYFNSHSFFLLVRTKQSGSLCFGREKLQKKKLFIISVYPFIQISTH